MKFNKLILNALLIKIKLNQNDLAQRLGKSRQVVNNWFNRESIPQKNLVQLRKLIPNFDQCLLDVDMVEALNNDVINQLHTNSDLWDKIEELEKQLALKDELLESYRVQLGIKSKDIKTA